MDLLDIAKYSEKHFGALQALRYVAGLEDCCAMLGTHPQAGRLYDPEHASRRRMERGSHVIFYRDEGAGIFVQRFLHMNMVPEFHKIG